MDPLSSTMYGRLPSMDLDESKLGTLETEDPLSQPIHGEPIDVLMGPTETEDPLSAPIHGEPIKGFQNGKLGFKNPPSSAAKYKGPAVDADECKLGTMEKDDPLSAPIHGEPIDKFQVRKMELKDPLSVSLYGRHNDDDDDEDECKLGTMENEDPLSQPIHGEPIEALAIGRTEQEDPLEAPIHGESIDDLVLGSTEHDDPLEAPIHGEPMDADDLKLGTMEIQDPLSAPVHGSGPVDASRFPVFSMGLETYKVPMSMHEENRTKLCDALRSKCTCPCGMGKKGLHPYEVKSSGIAGSATNGGCSECHCNDVVYLQGGTQPSRNDTDHEPVFRQESYFHYLFGVKEPGFAGAIDVKTGKTTLFVPRLPEEYATWLGRIEPLGEIKLRYGVEDVRYMEEVEDFLSEHIKLENLQEENDIKKAAPPEEEKSSSVSSACSIRSKVLLLEGKNTDSGATYNAPTLTLTVDKPNEKTTETKDSDSSTTTFAYIDKTTLHPVLSECRVIKSATELALIRHIVEVTSQAHVHVMKQCEPGMAEYQLESLFKHYVYFNHGCRNVAYTSICGCGPNAAVLHYGHAAAPNDGLVKQEDMCLLDMGAEYHGYASDVTCSFPASGNFTARQKAVYNGVLHAQLQVLNMLRPGVSWVECHKKAEEAILEALVGLDIVRLVPEEGASVTVEELVEKRLGAVFMPHGLGHLLGIDTHDVGGYPTPPTEECPARSALPGLKALRTARIMKEGMVVTVEPGCYFINHLLDQALADDSPHKPFLNKDVLDTFRNFGGVRLEDVVAVTSDGCTNFTVCPRTVEEIEGVMSSYCGKWPPEVDMVPELRRANLISGM